MPLTGNLAQRNRTASHLQEAGMMGQAAGQTLHPAPASCVCLVSPEMYSSPFFSSHFACPYRFPGGLFLSVQSLWVDLCCLPLVWKGEVTSSDNCCVSSYSLDCLVGLPKPVGMQSNLCCTKTKQAVVAVMVDTLRSGSLVSRGGCSGLYGLLGRLASNSVNKGCIG